MVLVQPLTDPSLEQFLGLPRQEGDHPDTAVFQRETEGAGERTAQQGLDTEGPELVRPRRGIARREAQGLPVEDATGFALHEKKPVNDVENGGDPVCKG